MDFSSVQFRATDLERGVRSIYTIDMLLVMLLIMSVPMIIYLVLFLSDPEGRVWIRESLTTSRQAVLAEVRRLVPGHGIHRYPKVLDHFGH
jgi:hypothetical protein